MAPGSAIANTPVKFSERIRTLGMGTLDHEATTKLDELTAEMVKLAKATGGKPKGQLVVKLDFKLNGDVFDIDYDIVMKWPKPARHRAILFAAPDGTLSDHSHTQTSLELPSPVRSIEAMPEPVRDMHAGDRVLRSL
jgi:hypothetical protein